MAVKALNGLQTSAEVLEKRRLEKEREGKEEEESRQELRAKRRCDEHHHWEARAKLLKTEEYLMQAGIQASIMLDTHTGAALHFSTLADWLIYR